MSKEILYKDCSCRGKVKNNSCNCGCTICKFAGRGNTARCEVQTPNGRLCKRCQ